VIFSQWLRMHELLVRRFEQREWQHVLFHGGVPGSQRKGLVDRFREDQHCRSFLATDAGGVGLNLQHASVVVNMDLPWNPAVLEQRIGRVHRLGQSRPVRVVNFVSQGTIEEGMLSVIRFKKSLFAGALDGGAKEVFLGGSRLTRFIQSVEKATGAIGEASVEDAGEKQTAAEAKAEPSAAEQERQAVAPSQAPADPWGGLLQSGLMILEQLATASRGGPTAQAAAAGAGLSLVRRDERTGENYVHIPMPSPEVLDRVLHAVGSLLARLRR